MRPALLLLLLCTFMVPAAALGGNGPFRYTKMGHIGAPGSGVGQFTRGSTGIAIDQQCGDIYMSDNGTRRVVHHFDQFGKPLGDIGSSGGQARGGMLEPTGLFLANAVIQPQNPLGPPTPCSGEGLLWVADYSGHRIDIFKPNGEVDGVWCNRTATFPAGVCDLTSSDFDYLPNDVWATDDNVFVAGRLSNSIREYTLDGKLIRSTKDSTGAAYSVAVWGVNLWSTYAGNGSPTVALWANDPTAAAINLVHAFPWALKAPFENTSSVWTGIDGTLYVVDRAGLQVFSPSGILRSTMALPDGSKDLAVRYDGLVYVTNGDHPGADVYSPGAVVTLSKRPGAKSEIVLAGKVVPAHARDAIVLQRAEENGWHTLAKLRLNSRSTFVYHWKPPRRLVHYRVRLFFHDPHPYHADRESAILDVASR